ncbi:MAG TPA: hypothetical protein VIM70_20400 [Clostridium sp.]|uniref:hypothetical protein n=1 Tax=Clostridium sp. TaxID=1506 RepID=UPI002F92E0CE
MKKFKTIRDSVHGYIEIEKEYMDLFIDSTLFQRLGRIEQTSMRVLYPSARHDRFIHSIGVFHLGKKAFNYFRYNFESENNAINIEDAHWKYWQKSFEIACLLHDIGHAPFSHTCEGFYQEEQTELTIGGVSAIPSISSQLFGELKGKLNEECYKEFIRDYGVGNVSPSPHEIVSSIVILKCFSDKINKMDADINLIVRSVIGCVFSDTSGEKGIQNCFIRMLNSPVIDVDKLDYITRDSSLTGFSNATIDSERLLKAFTAVRESGDDYYLAYNKNALSAIQNVISANNAELAWIVNHHVVVYNAYLIRTVINKISNEIFPKNPVLFKKELFSVDAIIGEKDCCGVFKVNMLTDDDLWHLFKLHDKIPEVKELLTRSLRKKAVWKSFAEFTLLFDEGNIDPKNGDFDFERFKESFNACCNDSKEFGNHLYTEEYIKENVGLVSGAGMKLYVILDDFAKENDLDLEELVIIEGSNPTKSNAVISRNQLRIRFFEGDNGTKRYDKVMKLLPQEKVNKKDIIKSPYFYLFYPKQIDKEKLCNFIKNHSLFKYHEGA